LAFLSALAYAIPLLVFCAAWEAAVTLRIINPDILPAFSSVVAAFVDLFTSGSNVRHLLITLYRTFLGLGLGMALGVVLALGMAQSRWVKTLFEPLLVLSYPLPKPAIIPLTMIWWGVGDFPKIVVVAVGCLLPMVTNTYVGLVNVEKTLVWSALAMGTSGRHMVRKVLLPGAMPYIFNGTRISLALSFIIIIANELVASRAGLGNLILTFGQMGTYDYMFGAMLAAILVAYAADRLLLRLGNTLLHWYKEEGSRI
jgi:ABC-type nitrate/sulfonate/bicarbonate transport system permease component